ncbi:hypothetical protein Ae201684P_001928 [Aphanomyces euteiches]|nr:hypothetical protein Ae201684P_001928 [Aphanomyces euteiches]
MERTERTPLLTKAESLGDTCPERNGCLSSMLFTWMNPLLDLGNKRPLEMEDLFQLNPDLRANSAHNRFQEYWERELTMPRPSLARALFYAFGFKFLAAGLLRLVRDSLQFVGPYVIQRVITYLLTPDAPQAEGLLCVAFIFFGGVLQSFCFRNYMYYVFETGLLFRSAIVSAVYRKSLQLSAAARSKHSAGEITNLMSIDAQRIQDMMADLHAIWYGPFLISVACTFLYWQMGAASFAGLAVIVLIIPITWCISRSMRVLQGKLMKVKDERIKACYEVLSGIKVIKFQAWEDSFQNRILDFRQEELRKLTHYLLARTASASLFNGVPSLVTIATFTTFVLMGHYMSTTTALTSLSLFAIMRYPLFVLPTVVNAIVEASVSFYRLESFLLESERVPVGHGNLLTTGIVLVNATFAWDEVSTRRRSIDAALLGAVGSGKSTLLSGLLGDAPCTQGSVSLRGSIAYVAQQPFIQNATVRDNICFGLPYDHAKYQEAIRVCCLEDDLKVLAAGDQTEIGEKGINLSGGQRTRVALARAVYQDTDIYLLDDILAAVDAHVGATIFRDCVVDFLSTKLVVLVTNNLQVLPMCDSIAVLQGGQVVEHATYTELMTDSSGVLAGMVAAYTQLDVTELPVSEGDMFATTPRGGYQLKRQPSSEIVERGGGLMTNEDRSTGDVPWRIYYIWLRACGGPFVAFAILGVFGLTQATNVASTLWLSHWASIDADIAPEARRFSVYLFIGLNLSFVVLIYVRILLLYTAGLVGSRRIFQALLNQVLRARMLFFDTTPLGRIVNRLSKDIYAVDEDIPSTWANVLTTLIGVAVTLLTILVVTPWFGLALGPLALFYWSSQRYFIKTETLDGLSTIRAFRVEPAFVHRQMNLVDRNQRAYYLNFSANCWLGLRLEFSGAMVASFATLFAVLNHSNSSPAFAGLAGVSLSYAFSVTPALNMSVRYLSQLQTQMVSIERVEAYTTMPTEREFHSLNAPPSITWPSSGEISFQNVDLRYRVGLPRVLRRLSCTITAKEKIGVVGRTGAGKSSLVVALMRLSEIDGGHIYIDGVDISTIGLHDLREKISIIPQDPVLFSGSIRSNVDPFNARADDEIWTALKKVHLTVGSLDDIVDERGANLSVGERQLLCIARAMLKRSKIILMDEATASIDSDTDRQIQRSFREVFADCTCITIAHRLNTIMDSDKILVMDRGSAVEFDAPKRLLKQKDSIFATLVARSRDSNK